MKETILGKNILISSWLEIIRGLLRRAEVDKAVIFAGLTRIWNFFGAPVSAIIIAIRFTPELQGYYYTFVNILALQVFVELGLGTVIVQFASHEWSQLRLDEHGQIVGDNNSLSRLISIANITTRWYVVGGAVVVLCLSTGGYVFFTGSPGSSVNWVAPWFLLCLLSGISICLVPIWSLLEGCNQVSRLYTYRFIQRALSSISVWIAILLGAKLWTASVSSIMVLIVAGVFLRSQYWCFCKTLLFTRASEPRINWRIDMLPMQWRIALSWICGYIMSSLFTPVLFKYHGPVVAGQMGMSWSLIGVLRTSHSWLLPRVPRFGMLIAQRKYKELDRLFWNITKTVICITVLIALAVWIFVYIINGIDFSLANRLAARLLPPLPIGLFILAQILITVSAPFSFYMRAHKREPIVVPSVSMAIGTGLSALILGKYYSVIGMAVGYLVVSIIIIPFIFFIWYRCRSLWHSNAVE